MKPEKLERARCVNPPPDLSKRTASPLSSQKVQVAGNFRTASTSSVPFLYHVRPLVQLFSHFDRANFKRKLKYAIAIKIPRFPPPPGAAVTNPRTLPRRSREAQPQSRPGHRSSLITHHSIPPKSIAGET